MTNPAMTSTDLTSTDLPNPDLPNPGTEPLTPDFYRYAPNPPSTVRLADGLLHLGWDDGSELAAHPKWLRENAEGPGGINPLSRENDLDPASIAPDLALREARLADPASLVVEFVPEGRTAWFHTGWLHHVATALHLPLAPLPEIEIWDADTLGEPPTHDAGRVLDDDASLHAWMTDLLRFGIARVSDAGVDPDEVARLATRVGSMRDSNFGMVWHVDVDLDPDSTANTSLALPAHTDLPTRETPPGFQFLHCIVNTAAGGESTMTDGLAVARHLETHEPEAFAALRDLEWVFVNRSPKVDHRWIGPIIDDGDGRVPYTFRAFHPVRGFPNMAPADIDRAYDALARFGAVANSTELQMRYAFRAGDIVAFDNRRVLHGRQAFTPGPRSRRRLHGTYMDTDEVYSRMRVLTRNLHPHSFPTES